MKNNTYMVDFNLVSTRIYKIPLKLKVANCYDQLGRLRVNPKMWQIAKDDATAEPIYM